MLDPYPTNAWASLVVARSLGEGASGKERCRKTEPLKFFFGGLARTVKVMIFSRVMLLLSPDVAFPVPQAKD